MTDPSQFLSGSDNLWKYLFTIGISLIGISVFYPLKKKDEKKLMEIEFSTDVKVIGKKIEYLKKDTSIFNKYVSLAKSDIDSLKKLKNTSKQIEEIHSEIAQERKKLFLKIQEIDQLVLENQGKEEYLNELESQTKTYKRYYNIGIILGLILIIWGGGHWLITTIDNENQHRDSNKLPRRKLFFFKFR